MNNFLLKENFESEIDEIKNELFILSNKNKIHIAISNYGARVVSILMPDNKGKQTELIVGFGNLNDFVHSKERYYGAIVGRYCNRIANGKFILEGKEYILNVNNRPNALHGGPSGMHSKMWTILKSDSQTLVLTYISKDGEEGYPGELTTIVKYTLNDDNELKIEIEATTNKTTIVNITNHNYWNLNGEGSGSILNHNLKINASKYLQIGETQIPIGIENVENTVFDFKKMNTIGSRIFEKNEQLNFGNGYDHNYILDKGKTLLPELIATVVGDLSNIKMEIFTTEPGVQLYTGNFMPGNNFMKNGCNDLARTAFCLETQTLFVQENVEKL